MTSFGRERGRGRRLSCGAALALLANGAAASAVCFDNCTVTLSNGIQLDLTFNGNCDDGGPGSETLACSFGTDCADCGSRNAPPSPPPSPSQPSPSPPAFGSAGCAAACCVEYPDYCPAANGAYLACIGEQHHLARYWGGCEYMQTNTQGEWTSAFHAHLWSCLSECTVAQSQGYYSWQATACQFGCSAYAVAAPPPGLPPHPPQLAGPPPVDPCGPPTLPPPPPSLPSPSPPPPATPLHVMPSECGTPGGSGGGVNVSSVSIVCTLDAAISSALREDARGLPLVIHLNAGTFAMSSWALNGSFLVSEVRIVGPDDDDGEATIVRSDASTEQLLTIHDGAPPITLRAVTLRSSRLVILGSRVVVEQCTLCFGMSPTDGGAIAMYNGSLNVRGSHFFNNRAVGFGGALYVGGGVARLRATLLNGSGSADAHAGDLIYVSGGDVRYVLPALAGRWIFPSGLLRNSELIVNKVDGDADGDYPFACAPGLMGGGSVDFEAQRGPQCSGPCPGGYFCPLATTQPITCPAGHFCTTGSPVPTPCGAGTYSDMTGLMLASQCGVCPRGYWCAPGVQISCDPGFYGPQAGASNQSACFPCPTNAKTINSSSTSIDDCMCNAGYYDVLIGSGVECSPCPVGTLCEGGATLDHLPLRPGYYRLSTVSIDVRKCPDSGSGCHGATVCDDTTSGCIGGVDSAAHGLCRHGLHGVFCATCTQPPNRSDLYYYVAATDDKAASCEPCTGSPSLATGVLIAILMLASVVAILAVHRHKIAQKVRLAPQTTLLSIVEAIKGFQVQLGRVLSAYKPRNKLKIMIGLYLIAVRVPSVYEVSLPTRLQNVFDGLAIVVSLGFQDIGASLECLGLYGYRSKLLVFTLVPYMLAVAIAAVAISWRWIRTEWAWAQVKPNAYQRSRMAMHAACAMVIAAAAAFAAFIFASTLFTAPAAALLGLLGAVLVAASLRGSQQQTASLQEVVMPSVLRLCFLAYPLVTNVAFEAFPCYTFCASAAESCAEEDERRFLKADVAVECGSADHDIIVGLAWLAIILYPVGLLLINAILLLKARNAIVSQRPTPLSRAIGFLHSEYTHDLFMWEIVEMARRLVLVGLMVLVSGVEQIVLGTLFSAAFFLAQCQAAPYVSTYDNALAAVGSFCLLVIFLCCSTFKHGALVQLPQIRERMSRELRGTYVIDHGSLSVLTVTALFGTLIFSLGIFTVTLEREQRREQQRERNARARRLRYVSDGTEAVLTPLAHGSYHLFLSHVWGTGQDQVRIIKQRLLEMLPDAKVFLDVDDLEEIGQLERYIRATSSILVYCSAGYFESRNCMRELIAATTERIPAIALIDMDASRGGLRVADVVEQLLGTEQLYARWGFDADTPRPQQLVDHLSASAPIEWNRLGHFQDVTMRLIAERLLPAEVGPTFIDRELASYEPTPSPPLVKRYHVCCNEGSNPGSVAVLQELAASQGWELRQDCGRPRPRRSAAGAQRTLAEACNRALLITTTVDEIAACDHLLLYLHAQTWTRGDGTSAALAHEVSRAIDLGVHVLLAHEMPGIGQDDRCPCEFSSFFSCTNGATPPMLLHRNIYSEIAVPLKGAEWRKPSLMLLAQALAKQVVDDGSTTAVQCAARAGSIVGAADENAVPRSRGLLPRLLALWPARSPREFVPERLEAAAENAIQSDERNRRHPKGGLKVLDGLQAEEACSSEGYGAEHQSKTDAIAKRLLTENV